MDKTHYWKHSFQINSLSITLGLLKLYRRFRYTSARNILYMQSQIAALAGRLEQLDNEDLLVTDEETKTNIRMCACAWESLERPSETDERAKNRLSILYELRPLMKAYRMLRYSIASPV